LTLQLVTREPFEVAAIDLIAGITTTLPCFSSPCQRSL